MKRYFPFLVIVFILVLTFIFPSVEYDKSAHTEYVTGDIAWMLMSTALVLIMTPGFNSSKERFQKSGKTKTEAMK